MTEPVATSGFERLVVRQKLTLMVNRYEIIRTDETGALLDVIAFAEQKRMAFKEQVTFFTDAGQAASGVRLQGSQAHRPGAGYDVTDASGATIGWFKKEFGASLLNSTWRLEPGRRSRVRRQGAQPEDRRGPADLGVPPGRRGGAGAFLFHFDFRAADGTVVLSSTRRAGIKDVYHLEMPAAPNGWRLDWRLGAAMGVALDALQSRDGRLTGPGIRDGVTSVILSGR